MSKNRSTFMFKRRNLLFLLAFTLIVQSVVYIGVLPSERVHAKAPELKLRSETPVTSGVQHQKYTWSGTRKDQPFSTNVDVIKVDLHNPHVRLDTLTGGNGDYSKRNTVLGMAKESGAVAAINGDFYVMTMEDAPLGAQVLDGEFISSTPFLPGYYTFAMTKDKQLLLDELSFNGVVTAANGKTFTLHGVNKAIHWDDQQQHSHPDRMFMYTSAWGKARRANDGVTKPTEIIVQDGIVTKIQRWAFDMAPPEDGYIIRGDGKAAEFLQENVKVGEPFVVDYSMKSTKSGKSYDPQDFQMMIGGYTVLVDQGKVAKFSREISSISGHAGRSRTAIGYSKDERYVYLITVDNNAASKGMTMAELQQFMLKIGVWKGMNLDGGGSTTLVARPLAEQDPVLANNTEYGGQRSVVNGIGVYTTAPVGEAAGFMITGPTQAFMHEGVYYSLKAYDEYYNPMDAKGLEVQWTAGNQEKAYMEGNKFTSPTIGKATITATFGKATASKDVEVVSGAQLAQLIVDAPAYEFVAGGKYPVPVKATTRTGMSRTVPAAAIEWELVGVEGVVEDGVFHLHGFEEEEQGYLIASYDGFRTIYNVAKGDLRTWQDFEKSTYRISFEGYPADVKGSVSLQKNYLDSGEDNTALRLIYDFTHEQSSKTKAAYARLGTSGGVGISGKPTRLMMDVAGDQSGNWIRAEVIDANGKTHMIDLSRNVDWTGWKRVETNLNDYALTYPIKMNRIYIVNPENGQQERALAGEIAFDNIQFLYANVSTKSTVQKIQMSVNEKLLQVDGKTMELDQAPIIHDDRTLVPIKFLIDALGGDVEWTPEEMKVTLYQGGHFIELIIDEHEVHVDGRLVTLDVPPTIRNSRTMIPLRFISEHIGLKVTWVPETLSIILES